MLTQALDEARADDTESPDAVNVPDGVADLFAKSLLVTFQLYK